MDEWVVLKKCARCRYFCGVLVGKVWRIVPCVYKIYTLDCFQFLKHNPIRFSGGGMLTS